jgi:hypothetical protein
MLPLRGDFLQKPGVLDWSDGLPKGLHLLLPLHEKDGEGLPQGDQLFFF